MTGSTCEKFFRCKLIFCRLIDFVQFYAGFFARLFSFNFEERNYISSIEFDVIHANKISLNFFVDFFSLIFIFFEFMVFNFYLF